MNTNERQYRITKAKTKRFVDALDEFERKADERADVHPRLLLAEREAMEAQLAVLRAEVEEYERVRDGGVSGVVVTSIDELPEWLIKARIASGLTQRELAARLHLKAQQIHRSQRRVSGPEGTKSAVTQTGRSSPKATKKCATRM